MPPCITQARNRSAHLISPLELCVPPARKWLTLLRGPFCLSVCHKPGTGHQPVCLLCHTIYRKPATGQQALCPLLLHARPQARNRSASTISALCATSQKMVNIALWPLCLSVCHKILAFRSRSYSFCMYLQMLCLHNIVREGGPKENHARHALQARGTE